MRERWQQGRAPPPAQGRPTRFREPAETEPRATITSNTTNAAMPATSLPSRRRRRPAGCTSLTPRTAKINMNATNPTARSRDTTDPSTDRASTLQPPRPARWPEPGAHHHALLHNRRSRRRATGSAASMARNHPITQRFAPRRRSNDTVRWWSARPPRPASTATPKNSTSSAPIGTANRFSVIRVRLLIDKQLVLGAGDVKTGRRRVCCDCADPADQSAEVDAAEIAGDDRCLPRVRTPDELQGRERRGWSHAVGQHDQLTVVRTELAAQHQVAGGDRCAHDGEPEGRIGREWRDRRGAPQIADEGHHFASISVAACRPHTVDQPSDAVEIVEPRKSNRAAVARRQCTELDGTNRRPETLSLQPAVDLGVEPIEIRGGREPGRVRTSP